MFLNNTIIDLIKAKHKHSNAYIWLLLGKYIMKSALENYNTISTSSIFFRYSVFIFCSLVI